MQIGLFRVITVRACVATVHGINDASLCLVTHSTDATISDSHSPGWCPPPEQAPGSHSPDAGTSAAASPSRHSPPPAVGAEE